jgi:hypothetical protein
LRWNNEIKEWEYVWLGADQYMLSEGETVMWRYERTS